MANAYVTGVSKTRFGPTTKTIPMLLQEAALAALADAELSISDIDAVVVANFLGGPNEKQLHLNAVFAGVFPQTNLPVWRVEGACASGGIAVHNAIAQLAHYPRILVIGIEKLSDIGGLELTRNIGMAGDALLDQPYGLTFPATYALVAQAYFGAYDATHADLELVSYKNHCNANRNPLAHFYHKTVTREEIAGSPEVATPLQLFDCCPVSDGAAAVIIESKPRTVSSVPILASSLMTDVISLGQRETATAFKSTQLAAKNAYNQAGLTPADIDFAEVHDCFTVAELVAIEDLGLAEPGQAARITREGDTQPDGRLPINNSGGLKAGGHAIGATGISQIYELVQQLRGTADKRQLERVRYGLAQNVGGAGGTCTVHILGGVHE